MTKTTRYCVHCGEPIRRRHREARTVYSRRRFCSRVCNCRHNGVNQRDHSSPAELLRRIGWAVTPSGCWEWRGRRNDNGYGESPVRVGDVKTGEYRAHRLAHIAWIGPIPDGNVVRHRCDNPPCINPDHLIIGTQIDNIADAVSRNRHAHAESHGGARLSAEDVRAIRNAHAYGATYRDLALQHGVSKWHIGQIVRRESWRSIA